MTVRSYEEEYRACTICCEPTMCATSRFVDIRVEGGDVVPFAVCESCVYNMTKTFHIEGVQDTATRSDAIPAGTISPERGRAIAQQLAAEAKQAREREATIDDLDEALDDLKSAESILARHERFSMVAEDLRAAIIGRVSDRIEELRGRSGT